MNQYTSITTFTQKPSVAQIVSYILFVLQVTTFYIIIQQNYRSDTSRIIFHVLYGLSILGQVISTTLASCIDPSDQFMISYKNDTDNAIRNYPDIQSMLYCDLCHSYVKLKSKHCKICKRCVQDFDHHCMWINNCIGSKNYLAFVFMIVFTFLSMVIYIASISVLWVQNYWDSYLAGMVVLWVSGFVICIFTILMFNLILLHIYLGCKGLTTFQLIVIQREEKRLQEIEDMMKKNESQNKKRSSIVVHQINQVKLQVQKQQSQVQEQHNKTEENIISKKKFEVQDLDQSKNSISDKKMGNSEKLEIQSKNNFPIFEDHQKISESSNNSVQISNFFTRNKSLRIFVGDQIQKPLVSNTRSQKVETFSKSTGITKIKK